VEVVGRALPAVPGSFEAGVGARSPAEVTGYSLELRERKRWTGASSSSRDPSALSV